MIVRTKGTPAHRQMGKIYVYTLLVATISIFFVYHFDIQFAPLKTGPGIFGLFHYENVVTLVFLLLGFVAASRQRHGFFAYAHPFCMLFTYYMLIAGLINELFVRVPVLRAFAMAQLPAGARNPAQSPLVGMVQMVAMLWFFGALIWFGVKVARHRGSLRVPCGDPSPAE